ncbi:MAG TPA: hypothetical protein VNN08_21885 [Thermoanaerobaculia bacterium]|nr:hypothetical protein [Thermoanaerobaculia bacterium]
MSATRWSALVIITVAVMAGAFVAVNGSIDPMGLFHSRTRIVIYTNERWSKYLLSIRYVPEQFDAVLVGTSVTGNWNTGFMQPLRTYNLSIEGGNIYEERLLLENVFKRRKPRVVLFCIHPYLTASYGRQTPYMTNRDYWSALGSLELLKTYHARRRVERHVGRQEFNEFGQQDFKIPVRPWRAQAIAGGRWYVVDERSFAEYGRLVASARAAGSRVVAVVPPVNAEQWLYTADAYREYQHRILTFFRGDELVIDFNTAPYDGLRGDRSNFPDGIHLSSTAADIFVKELARLVRNGTDHPRGFRIADSKTFQVPERTKRQSVERTAPGTIR